MPIEGLLGFRANVWQQKEEDGTWIITSPDRKSFVWDDPVVQAECIYLNTRGYDRSCHYDELGYLHPGPECRCGIYVTLSKATLSIYMRSRWHVTYLVEQLGGFVACYDNHLVGWRGGGAQIVAVVSWSEFQVRNALSMTPHELGIVAAAEKFGVPILPYQHALEMAKIQWAKEDLEWTSAMADSWTTQLIPR